MNTKKIIPVGFEVPSIKDEVQIVKLYDIRKGAFVEGYYATADGQIISFKNKMRIYKQTPTKDGYYYCLESGVHRWIAFSFLAYWLEHKDEPLQITIFGAEINTFDDLQKIKGFHVHHMNNIRSDNRVENLEILPADAHRDLILLNHVTDDEKRFEFFDQRKSSLKKYVKPGEGATVVVGDKMEYGLIHYDSLKDIFDGSPNNLKIESAVIEDVIKDKGPEYFENRKYILIKTRNGYYYVMVLYNRKENNIEVHPVENAPYEYEIVCNGQYWKYMDD